MRTRIVAGNWKMNLTPEQTGEYVRDLDRALAQRGALRSLVDDNRVELVLFPTALCLPAMKEALYEANLSVLYGAQNAHWERHGAYTGEIGASVLAEFGCTYILIGHSERRHLFHESDEDVARKVRALLETSASCLLCVGEQLEEREAGRAEEVLTRQLLSAIAGLAPDVLSERIVVAYEPVWAIGTGKTASDADAQEGCRFLRRLVAERFGDAVAENVRMLYGGSVKPENAKGLFAQADVDGLLVGGASLKVEPFLGILEAASA